MRDNDLRLDKEPYPGETKGEQLMRVLDKSAPWEPVKRGCGTGGDRIADAMRRGAQHVRWVQKEIVPRVEHRGWQFEAYILQLCHLVKTGERTRADVYLAINTAETGDKVTAEDVVSFLEVMNYD